MEYEQLLEKAFEKIQKKTTLSRFKIPELVLESQGSKTVVKNFSEISYAIRREGAHLAKYFFKELATPGSIQGDALVLQARVSKDSLQKKFADYLKEYVYCKVCSEPDTKLSKEDRITFVVCEACGAKKPAR